MMNLEKIGSASTMQYLFSYYEFRNSWKLTESLNIPIDKQKLINILTTWAHFLEFKNLRITVAEEYGICRLAEGGEVKNPHLVIIVDVITSGGQVIESVPAMRDQGTIITDVVCVIDREAGGVQNLAAENLKQHALVTITDIKSALKY